MSLALIFAIVAVGVVAVYALGQRSGEKPERSPRSLAWLVGAALAIWVGLAALTVGAFLVDEWRYSEDSQPLIPTDPENLVEPCADADADTMSRLEANLVGDPARAIAVARTSTFNIDGDEMRVIMAWLVGPGLPDDPAVFIVDPSGATYAENDFAREVSSFEAITLDLTLWDEPLGYASRC